MNILDIAIAKGYTEESLLGAGALKGQDGKDGVDGKSAYEIACDNGFEGTEQEWLDSLKAEGSENTGEDNTINSISVNGTTLTPDANKNVDITIPTISSEEGNAIIEKQDGLYVPSVSETKVSEAENNIIETKEDGIYVAPTDLSDYVTKEDGKGLSTNDLTNELKTAYDKAVTDSHTHDNKDVIDGITEEKVTAWDKAEENVQSDWEQIDDTADDFIKNKPTFEVLSEDDVLAMVGLSSEELEGLATILADEEVRIDKTYSSSKIYSELNRILEEGKTYTLEEIAKTTGASYKIATSTADMTSTKFIYLLANGDTYDMYICEEENSTPVKIGTTSVNLTDYYNKTECDERFVLATAFVLLNNSVGDVTTLQTTAKVITDAINELLTVIGDITTLKTTAKDNVVNAVNEVVDTLTETKDALGDTVALETTDKTSVVNAVNEVKKSIDEFEMYTELTQEEYDALADDETGKLNGVEYRTTDTGKIYKNGVQYGKDGVQIDDTTTSAEKVWSSQQIAKSTIPFIVYDGLPDGYDVETAIKEIYTQIPDKTAAVVRIDRGSIVYAQIYKTTNDWGRGFYVLYNGNSLIKFMVQNGVFTFDTADVAKTTIVPNTAYFKQTVDGQPSFYVVRNGVCYVNLDMTCVTAGTGILQTILPKPIDIVNISVIPFNTTEKSGVLTLYTGGAMQSFAMTTGARYMTNFSYPVA